MALRVYVSNIEAGYFLNNKLSCGSNPPSEGNFNVGDICISSIQKDGVLGWVCVEAGDPGKWEVICDIVEVKKDIEMNKFNINELIERLVNATAQISHLEFYTEDLERRIENNEDDIVEINSQIDTAKKTLVTLSGQILNNTKNITEANKNIVDLTKVVESNASNCVEGINNVEKEVTDLKTLVGDNADAAGEAATGLMKEINDLKQRIDVNDEADEVSREAILEELTEIRQIVGLENKEDGEPSLQDRLDELEEFVGKNAEDGEEVIGNIVDEITDLKELVGKPRTGEDIPGTGLIKEVEYIQEEIVCIQNDVRDMKEELLKFWVGTQEQYNALEEKEQGRLYIIIN